MDRPPRGGGGRLYSRPNDDSGPFRHPDGVGADEALESGGAPDNCRVAGHGADRPYEGTTSVGVVEPPYPTSSPALPRRCFVVASASVGQWLGLALGGFVSLAASLDAAERPLSANPWLVLFVLVVLSSAVSWYVATDRAPASCRVARSVRSGPGGSTTPTFCCNWSHSADFRAAVVDVLAICAGFGLGLGVTSADVPSGGAVVGGTALGLFAVHLTARRYCCRDSGGA